MAQSRPSARRLMDELQNIADWAQQEVNWEILKHLSSIIDDFNIKVNWEDVIGKRNDDGEWPEELEDALLNRALELKMKEIIKQNIKMVQGFNARIIWPTEYISE